MQHSAGGVAVRGAGDEAIVLPWSDGLGLVELDLLLQDRRGTAFIFSPAPDLAQRLDA
ncbi:hypothetical protein ACW7G0_13015 [Lysobacter sp. A286]